MFELSSKLPSQIKDTCDMLEINDDVNNSNLSSSIIIVNKMFPSIDNDMGFASIRKYVDKRECKDFPTDCVTEALELCLYFNNSIFNNTNYLKTDGTDQGPHMSSSYADIAMTVSFFLSPKTWKRFRKDIFLAWEHGTDTCPLFLDYLNNVDEAGKIKFTMEIADQEKGLRIKCVESKLLVDVFAKPKNSFTYVKPSTSYPHKSINKVPHGIALRLYQVCDIDEKFESCTKNTSNI